MSATTTNRVLCGNCKGYHPTAMAVKACYMSRPSLNTQMTDQGVMDEDEVFQSIANGTSVVVRNEITQPQADYIRRLLDERQTAEPMDADVTLAALATLDNPKQGAGALIDGLVKLPRKPKAKPAKVEHGAQVPGTDLFRGDIHFLDGRYVRVHISQGTGKPYASVYSENTGKFEYVPKLVRRLSAATKATPEQAKAFGDMYERCCFCLTPIDTPESTAVGYGPKCASKFGLPWG